MPLPAGGTATVPIAGFDFLDTGGAAAQAAFNAILAQAGAANATQLAGINLALANLTGADPYEAIAAGFRNEFPNITADYVRQTFDIDQVFRNAQVSIPELAAFSAEAIQRRRLGALGIARSGVRNPFRSLQLGPFVPCSADDPAGRCLSTPVKRHAQRLVAETLEV